MGTVGDTGSNGYISTWRSGVFKEQVVNFPIFISNLFWAPKLQLISSCNFCGSFEIRENYFVCIGISTISQSSVLNRSWYLAYESYSHRMSKSGRIWIWILPNDFIVEGTKFLRERDSKTGLLLFWNFYLHCSFVNATYLTVQVTPILQFQNF